MRSDTADLDFLEVQRESEPSALCCTAVVSSAAQLRAPGTRAAGPLQPPARLDFSGQMRKPLRQAIHPRTRPSPSCPGVRQAATSGPVAVKLPQSSLYGRVFHD
uniref:Uncharacterized protein n=1 Tax=Setaria viridis TaxID=4556 RepID=A0A4U6UPL5_SETVI|nr:hypothetical protein SEVIR_5G268601v2 [Setaria viridis]